MSEDVISMSESNIIYCGNYSSDVSEALAELQQAGSMVDVSFRTGDEQISVHRMVLCASSPFLQQLLSVNMDPFVSIILPEVDMVDLKTVVEFLYRGEINFAIDHLHSVQKVAKMLGIQGLQEICSHLPEEVDFTEPVAEMTEGNIISLPLWESDLGTEEEDVAMVEEVVQLQQQQGEEMPKPNKHRKRLRMNREKKYSEEMLEDALQEMRAGRSLCDTSQAYNIPRTTLYMRARSSGVISPSQKMGYNKEQLQEAINTVMEGTSLQNASKKYGVPKTVLWRRVQALRGDTPLRHQQTYSPADKQAAVEALERGENLQAVANQFPIPKTTLFREKVRLVEKGILPSDSIKRRKGETSDFTRAMRVEQAVAACKDGKMSQAAASIHFQVPKTTIWRKMQQLSLSRASKEKEAEQFEGDIKFVTEDGEYATASLIILSTPDDEQGEQMTQAEELNVTTNPTLELDPLNVGQEEEIQDEQHQDDDTQ